MQSRLPDLHIFARVAEAESFRAAAEQLRMARSSVSRRISQLETELGVALFNRSTRRISLTHAGQTLFQHWKTIACNVDDALAAVQGVDQMPSGVLRISVPSSLGAALMPAIMQSFLSKWPDLKASLDFGDRYVDVVGEGFDVVIRVAPKLRDSRLTARRLATTHCVLAASPEYFALHGRPKRLKDLSKHRCLALGYLTDKKMCWSFDADVGSGDTNLEPAFAANNDLALILAACLDGGLLYLPKLLIDSEVRLGRLEIVTLEDVNAPEWGVFAVYPQARAPAKVKVFVEFVADHLSRLETLDRWAPLNTPRLQPAADKNGEAEQARRT